MSENEQMAEEENLRSMGILDHFEELRWCIFRCLIALAFFFPFGCYFSDNFISFSKSLTKVSYFTALGPAEPFTQKLLVGVYLAVFAAFPYLVFQIWRFISPGLYERERDLGRYVLFIAYLLFLCGAFFGLTIVVPISLDYFLLFSGDSIIYQPQLKEIISFIFKVSIGMGIAAQLPVAIIVFYSLGILTVDHLTKNRSIVVVVIFILASFLTPPDVISLLLLAMPLYICYELSTLFCRMMDKSVGEILHRKRSRMFLVSIFFLVTFLALGILSQVYRGIVRRQLHDWVGQVVSYWNGGQKKTIFSLANSKERLEVLRDWQNLAVKDKLQIQKKLEQLLQKGKLNTEEKFVLFTALSNFGLVIEDGKVNVKISLASQFMAADFQMIYYLKALVKDGGEESIHHLYFSNRPQYLSYTKGDNSLMSVQINDIISHFSLLKTWRQEQREVTLWLILSPVKQAEWLRVMQSKPFKLISAPLLK